MKKELSYIFHLLSHKLFDLEKYSLEKIQPSFFHSQFFFYQSYNSNTNRFQTKSSFGQNTHPKLNQY